MRLRSSPTVEWDGDRELAPKAHASTLTGRYLSRRLGYPYNDSMSVPPASQSASSKDPVEKGTARPIQVASPPLGAVTEVRGLSASLAINPKCSMEVRIGDLLSIQVNVGSIVSEVTALQRAQHTVAEVKFIATVRGDVITPGVKDLPDVGAHAGRCDL